MNYLSGTSWVAHRKDMIESVAWRTRSVPLAKILERLEIEHMRHGGTMNGSLCVSYGQFVQHNVTRKKITRSLRLGEDLGLLKVVRPPNSPGPIRSPNHYRLTYLPTPTSNPTDEWKSVNTQTAQAAWARYVK